MNEPTLTIGQVATSAGFTLDDGRALLATGSDGGPAHHQIRELAQRKLPEVNALIERAEAMKRWLTIASGCNCQTLDVCRLFEAEHRTGDTTDSVRGALELQLTHVGYAPPRAR